MFRLVARSSAVHARPFHSTAVAHKTVTEKVSEVAETVNKKVGKGLADAIDAGQKTADEAKKTVKSTTEEGQQKAGEAAAVAGQKKNEAVAGAHGAKDEAKEEIKKKL